MSYLLNCLAALEYEPSVPGLEVIEPQSVLDENLAQLAFEEAERFLVRQGFAEMDAMSVYAEPRAEALKVAAYAPRVEVAA